MSGRQTHPHDAERLEAAISDLDDVKKALLKAHRNGVIQGELVEEISRIAYELVNSLHYEIELNDRYLDAVEGPATRPEASDR